MPRITMILVNNNPGANYRRERRLYHVIFHTSYSYNDSCFFSNYFWPETHFCERRRYELVFAQESAGLFSMLFTLRVICWRVLTLPHSSGMGIRQVLANGILGTTCLNCATRGVWQREWDRRMGRTMYHAVTQHN